MDDYTEKDIVKIAMMYYDEQMTQAEIGRRLGISRSLVSKMLIEARDKGIVEIFINSQSLIAAKIELKLQKKFQLKDAVVIDTNGVLNTEIQRKVSRAAAIYLTKFLKRNSAIKKIGLSWGQTLRDVVDQMPYINHSGIDVYPTIGGMGTEFFSLHSNQIVQTFAQKVRGKAHYLYVPAMVSSYILRKQLEEDSMVSCILRDSSQVDLGIFGAAPLADDSTMRRTGYLSQEELSCLEQLGIVGDMNSRFYDKEGESNYAVNQQVLGLTLEEIKSIPTVIAIAYGEGKSEALKPIIKNNIIDILITTDTTAQEILGNMN